MKFLLVTLFLSAQILSTPVSKWVSWDDYYFDDPQDVLNQNRAGSRDLVTAVDGIDDKVLPGLLIDFDEESSDMGQGGEDIATLQDGSWLVQSTGSDFQPDPRLMAISREATLDEMRRPPSKKYKDYVVGGRVFTSLRPAMKLVTDKKKYLAQLRQPEGFSITLTRRTDENINKDRYLPDGYFDINVDQGKPIGVYFNDRWLGWRAEVNSGGKRFIVGVFDYPVDAGFAYDQFKKYVTKNPTRLNFFKWDQVTQKDLVRKAVQLAQLNFDAQQIMDEQGKDVQFYKNVPTVVLSSPDLVDSKLYQDEDDVEEDEEEIFGEVMNSGRVQGEDRRYAYKSSQSSKRNRQPQIQQYPAREGSVTVFEDEPFEQIQLLYGDEDFRAKKQRLVDYSDDESD